MIGIVLWSDPDDRKAVFWCEDQGDLAYFDTPDPDLEGGGGFLAGDMVQFDVTIDHRVRKAHSPRLLHESVCTDLPATLKRSAAPQIDAPQDQQSATILPFSLKEDQGKHGRKVARKA